MEPEGSIPKILCQMLKDKDGGVYNSQTPSLAKAWVKAFGRKLAGITFESREKQAVLKWKQ
jgi:hypothetical protein